jgi:peroxiredoxin
MNKVAVVRAETGVGVAVLLIVLTVMSALVPGSALAVNCKAGLAAPDFTVRTLRGDTVSLHDYNGKVVLVMFWSSWCSRCREELDFLKTMKVKYPELEILALNSESDKQTAADVARIEAAVQSWNLALTVAIDEGLRVWNLYEVNALPTSMIVGADGTILFIEPNFYWASPETFDSALGSAFGIKANVALPDSGSSGGIRTDDGAHVQAQRGEFDGQDSPFDVAELEKDTCRKALCLVAELPKP